MHKNKEKIAIIGRINSGKTTLIKKLSNEFITYAKTQQVTYSLHFIDTPGEFVELPCFRPQAINVVCDAGLIILVNACIDCQNSIPPNFVLTYNAPVIGVITKIDHPKKKIKRSHNFLTYAGIKPDKIFEVSAHTGEGVPVLKEFIENYVSL
jgi:ethanolamine utilization protein EutP